MKEEHVPMEPMRDIIPFSAFFIDGFHNETRACMTLKMSLVKNHVVFEH